MKQLMTGIFGFLMMGCSQIDRLSDEQLAADLNVGAKSIVKYSLKLALKKLSPEDQAKVSADAQLADKILVENILPIFSGTSTADLLRSSVDQALSQLKGKIKDPRVSAAIELGTELIIADVTLPKNPADKIDARTRLALQGVFTGISAGIQAVFPPGASTPR